MNQCGASCTLGPCSTNRPALVSPSENTLTESQDKPKKRASKHNCHEEFHGPCCVCERSEKRGFEFFFKKGAQIIGTHFDEQINIADRGTTNNKQYGNPLLSINLR